MQSIKIISSGVEIQGITLFSAIKHIKGMKAIKRMSSGECKEIVSKCWMLAIPEERRSIPNFLCILWSKVALGWVGLPTDENEDDATNVNKHR